MKSPTYGNVSIDEMLELITKYVNQDLDGNYEITVGSDSQTFGNKTKYVLVITCRKVGNGGIFFYEIKWFEKSKTLQHKIHQEVQMSLDMASIINTFVDEMDKENINFTQIDVDIGANGETREFIREIRGWIEAIGDTPVVIKGEKIGQIATVVANRISK